MKRLTVNERMAIRNNTLMALAYVPTQSDFDACKFRMLRMFAKLMRGCPKA